MKKITKSKKPTSISGRAVEEGVRKILAEVARAEVSDIKEDTNIREDLGIDSLNAMEILAALEIKFKITIDEAKAFDIITVNDLFEAVKQYLKKR